MNFELTPDQHKKDVKEMLKWLEKELAWGSENMTYLWNILADLRSLVKDLNGGG